MPNLALKNSYSKYKDNVMDPLKWTTIAFQTLLTTVVCVTTQGWIRVVFVFLMIIILSVYYGIYIFWALKDPNRLQSEGFNLEEAAMIMSREKNPEINLENKTSNIK